MPVSDTSIRAYAKHVIEGKAISQRERILYAIRCFAPISREELAALFSAEGLERSGRRWWAPPPRIPLASVCGRVNVLLGDPAKGWPAYAKVVEVREVRGHRVQFLGPVDPQPAERDFSAFMSPGALATAAARATDAFSAFGQAVELAQGRLGL